MIRRPPRSTRVRSSAASDVYKRQIENNAVLCGIVHHWNTAGCEHLERHERDIGRGQDETGYAAIVESTEFGWAEEPMMGRAKGRRSYRLAIKVDLDLRVRTREEVERKDRQFVCSPRGRGPAVIGDADAISIDADRAIKPIHVQIAAEVEIVGVHAVIAGQKIAEPLAGGYAIKSKSIGCLGEKVLAACRSECGLVVLNEVTAHALCVRPKDGVRGPPSCREDGMAVFDTVGQIAYLGPDRRPPLFDRFAMLFDVPSVLVLKVDHACVPSLLQRSHDAKHGGVPT